MAFWLIEFGASMAFCGGDTRGFVGADGIWRRFEEVAGLGLNAVCVCEVGKRGVCY